MAFLFLFYEYFWKLGGAPKMTNMSHPLPIVGLFLGLV